MTSKELRKAAAFALAGTMALSFASCALLGNDKKDVADAADGFASTLLKKDAGKVIKLTTAEKDDDAAVLLNLLFDESLYSDNENEFIKAVGDTITYEVDEDSVKADKDEASAVVVFTVVDYEEALKDGGFTDIDEVVDAIEDCDDTNKVEFKLEFEKDGDDWLVSNLDDLGFEELFGYYNYDLKLKSDLLSLLDYAYISGSGNAVYLDIEFTTFIELENDVTFDVYYEGYLLASGLEPEIYSSSIFCSYIVDGYIPSGTYNVIAKYGDTILADETITLDNSAVETTPSVDTVSMSAYQKVLAEYEDELRMVENSSVEPMDSCALKDITGDGYPELLIQYCSDEDYGIDTTGSTSYTYTDIRIYTAAPGDEEASEMLHLAFATSNLQLSETDIFLLSNGNLFVASGGGDTDYICAAYDEYEVEGNELALKTNIVNDAYYNDETGGYDYDFYIDGTAISLEEFNSLLEDYQDMFTSKLAVDNAYDSYSTSSSSWNAAVINTPSSILSFDEAWEVTAE